MDKHTQPPVEIIASLEKRLAAMEAQEASLVAENTLLRQLYERAPLAYQSLDCNGCFIEVNQAWLETLGYTREEVIGRHFGDFLHPDWRDHFQENFPRFKLLGEILGIEFEMIKKDGSPILVSFHGKIGKNAEGHFQQTHCIFQDMTRRKREEEALRESEERFRAIYNASFGGILIHDQGIILDCNQGLSEQTGYSVEELIGMDGLLLTAPDYRDLVLQNIELGFGQPYEIVALRKDGTRYPVSVRGADIPYKGRTVRMSELRDITEYKRMEEALEKRLVTLTCPLDQTKGIAFEDLFDPAVIQRIQDEFARATGVASIITHPDGIPITAPSNFTRLCGEIIRKTEQGYSRCLKSDAAIGGYHPSGPIVQLCLSGGLWNAGASITVGGHHIANWLIGQVRNEAQSEDKMRAYAHAIGTDETAFMEAFQAVPSMPREQFEHIARALFTLANQLSSAAYQNIQQARSITERKHAEEALRKSEERFRLAMEATQDGLWDWDIASGDVYYSPGYWSMLGYDAETRPPSAEAWAELINPDDKEAVCAANNDCIENRCETFLIEYRMRTSNGRWKWIQGRGKAIERDENGYALRMIGTHIDITERKRAEEQLRKAEAYARNLIEVNLDPLVTIAPDGRISDVNKASILATGCSREEMIGTDFSSYFTDPDKARAGYQQVFEKGTVRDYPLEIRHRDGHVTPVLYNASVFLDGAQQVAGVFAAARDITQLKQAQNALQAINLDLERRVEQRTLELQESQKQYLHAEKLSAIGKLSASIAHEFKNPLQGILSILKGLKKRAVLNEEDRELLDAAIGEGDRIRNLIRSLQDFNRPSSGRKTIMDVHESLDAILLLHKSDFNRRRISLVCNYAEQLPHILAVSDQIKQVFLNLLANAADACDERGGMITVSTWLEGDKVAVAIKDTGVGIKPEEMEHIFRPFFTTKSEVKGTGLGLSVSYGIVKNHQGEIRVESQSGEGATFTILLPIMETTPQ